MIVLTSVASESCMAGQTPVVTTSSPGAHPRQCTAISDSSQPQTYC